MALYFQKAEEQVQAIKDAKPKREKKPRKEVETIRCISSTLTGLELKESLEGWRKPTGLVNLFGVSVTLGVLQEIGDVVGKGLVKLELCHVKETLYSAQEYGYRRKDYNGSALQIQYEFCRNGQLADYAGTCRIIHTPGIVDYHLEIR
jgi:hypothetical protein